MITFGGQPVVDPRLFRQSAARLGLDTASWWGKANAYRCPVGCRPGQGWLLMARKHFDALTADGLHDLVFRVHPQELSGPRPTGWQSEVRLLSLLPVGTACLTPGLRRDDNEVLLVQLADRRWLYQNVPVELTFNVPKTPSADLYADTTDGGTPWTWAQVGQQLWENVGTARLGAWPGLPFTPHGTPYNIRYAGMSGMAALEQFLARVGCALVLDPVADAFSVKRLGVTNSDLTRFLLDWDAWRVTDSDPLPHPRATVPASVRVLFRKLPPVPGESPFYVVDVATPGTYLDDVARAEADTYHLVRDDLFAEYDSGGTLQNSSDLNDRAAERAADYARWLGAGLEMFQRTYALATADSRVLPGDNVWDVEWRDLGAGQQTVLRRQPLEWMRQADFEPLRNEDVSTHGGSGGGGSSTTTTWTGSTINVNSSSTLNIDNTSTIVVAGSTVHTPTTLATWTGNQTNLSVGTATRIRIASDAHYRELRSVAAVAGRVIYFHNVGDYVILLAHEDSGSTAANRIATTTGNYHWLAPDHEAALWYDSTVSRWRVAENTDERLHGIGADYALTADAADLDLDRDKLQHRITPDTAGWTISGIAGGQPGLKYHIINGSDADSFTLLHNDVGSSAANRFFLPNGDDVEIAPRAAFVIEYEGNDDRWRLHFLPQDPTAALTNTYVGYGSAGNVLTGTEDFTRVAEGQVVVKTDDDTVSPSLTLRRRRNGSADVDTGDIMGEVIYQGYLAGDQPQAYVRGRYTGNGTNPGGQLELVTVDSANTATNAIIIDEDALVYVDTANATSELVGTGASGELVNVSLGYLLKRSSNTLDRKFRGARAYESVTTNTYAGTSTWISVPLDAETYDTDSLHDNSTNNSRLTIPTGMGGYWDFRGFFYPDLNGNAAGTVVQIRIMLNAATVLALSIGHIDASGAIAVAPIFSLRSVSAGDYVELQVYHNGGANMKGYGADAIAFLEANFVGVAP